MNRAPGPDLRASGPEVRTHDVHPKAPAFEGAQWQAIDADDLEARRTNGRLAFGWYRLEFTVPPRIDGLDTAGAALTLEITADDYAEVWIDGRAAQVLGQTGAGVIGGWNTPSRTIVTSSAQPGQRHQIAIFAANGPLSSPPTNFIWIRSATLDLYRPGRLANGEPVAAKIARLDPALDDVLSPDARVERLAQGFGFGEGPVWVPAAADGRYGGGGPGGYLRFSDPNQNVIHRWDPTLGEVSIFRARSGYSGVGDYPIGQYHQPGSNGLALDPAGRLTICEHGNRRVSRLEPNGTLTVLADHYEGKRLNSPNDLVYRSDGALFFTDPPFGLPGVFADPRKELPFSGVFCLYNGQVRLACTDLAAPNGLAFSPDERFLYIDNWEEQRKVVMRYEVGPDGSLSGGRVFFDMTSTPGEICLDGLKVDRAGRLFVSGPGGVWIISPDGRHLGTISPPELPANFAFGDEDARMLYMTARTGLYRVRLNQPGR
ncbi:MAG: SMP-30/gluconolactonase/LRE family protein [Phycisphaerales bacterium]|nr:SMP-30/gluconolactonase/LRE family protein [Phycisphaerales bacterium]